MRRFVLYIALILATTAAAQPGRVLSAAEHTSHAGRKAEARVLRLTEEIKPSSSNPQNPYVTVRTHGGIVFQVPRNWRVLSDNQLVTLDAASEAHRSRLGEVDFSGALTFAANYIDDAGTTAAMMNIRFYPDQRTSQQEVKGLSASELLVYDKEAREQLAGGLPAIGSHLASYSGTTRQALETFTALVSEYRRTSATGTFCVRLVRVLDASRSFTLTVSHKEGQARVLEPITTHMIATLRRQ